MWKMAMGIGATLEGQIRYFLSNAVSDAQIPALHFHFRSFQDGINDVGKGTRVK
jgi:hypothetical protein